MRAPEPRTWHLPPEPGPEVWRVQDRTGCFYQRDERAPAAWHLEMNDGRLTRGAVTWEELMGYAPLTDSSYEVVTR